MKRKLLPLAAVLLGAILNACAVNGPYVARYGPPPPPRYGMVGAAPGPGFVWTDGFWDQRGGNWFWSGGRWVHPPRPRAVWVPGNWSQTHRGFDRTHLAVAEFGKVLPPGGRQRSAVLEALSEQH